MEVDNIYINSLKTSTSSDIYIKDYWTAYGFSRAFADDTEEIMLYICINSNKNHILDIEWEEFTNTSLICPRYLDTYSWVHKHTRIHSDVIRPNMLHILPLDLITLEYIRAFLEYYRATIIRTNIYMDIRKIVFSFYGVDDNPVHIDNIYSIRLSYRNHILWKYDKYWDLHNPNITCNSYYIMASFFPNDIYIGGNFVIHVCSAVRLCVMVHFKNMRMIMEKIDENVLQYA
jgi:hypothetical protein